MELLPHDIQFQTTLSHSQYLKLQCQQKPQTQSLKCFFQKSRDGFPCNYCKTGISYCWGLTSPNFEPYTYQVMLERGWRRSGTYYYKLDLQKSCCKQWTHRLDTNHFKIKKDQRKTIRKMRSWCYRNQKSKAVSQNKKKNQNQNQNQNEQDHNQKKKNKNQKPKSMEITVELSNQILELIKGICLQLNAALKTVITDLIPKQKLETDHLGIEWNFQFLSKLKSFPSKAEQKCDYYCNWGSLLYGVNKLKLKGLSLIDFIKSIKQKVQEQEVQKGFSIELQRGGYLLISHLKTNKIENPKTIELDQPNQTETLKIQQPKKEILPKQASKKNKGLGMSIEQPSIKVKQPVFHQQQLKSQVKDQLIITFSQITFGKLKIKIVQAEQDTQSWKMYQRYCTEIHQQEQRSFKSYIHFLCKRALTFSKTGKDVRQDNLQHLPRFDPAQTHQKKQKVFGKIMKLQGCYHMKYYYQEKFIAVGVIDLLPNGLSSVYYFYQPEYKDRRLGVFSALIEIEYIRYVSLAFPEFKYYYMGFYIHNNEKMSYKGDYEPFQLLCPVTYNFVTFDQRVLAIVNKVANQANQNIRLAVEGVPIDPDMNFQTDLEAYIDQNIKIMTHNRQLKLKDFDRYFSMSFLSLLKSFTKVFGKQLFEILTFTV